MQDDHKFVLDTVLIENDNSAPMAKYWDDYKLQIVLTHLKQFLNIMGIEIDFSI